MEVKEILSKCDHTLLAQNGHLEGDPGHLRRWYEVRLRQRLHPCQLCQAGGGVCGGKAAHLHGDRLPQRV